MTIRRHSRVEREGEHDSQRSIHTPFMRLHGARMADNGYAIVPIAPGEKFPAEYRDGAWRPMRAWQRYAEVEDQSAIVDLWSNWPGAGVGIVLGGRSGVVAVDIDIMDPAAASAHSRAVSARKVGQQSLSFW